MPVFSWLSDLSNLGKTATEIKRDDYQRLYEELTDAITEHDRKVSEANSAYSSYQGSVPNLSNTKIPSNDFETTREKKNGELLRYFGLDQDKRSSLVAAKNLAYERYVYYRALAIQEAEERARREREAAEALAKEVVNAFTKKG
ncbi:hypothetical protein HPT25_09335 [Bacillus sp. BRMEA1]|uniref:hypothetical protein n=1 Tax=Neobacillus endophyticus TaxID=2738405 RepID=UPI001565E997|nr:hypothetical protein [Neobacillus endophyticus]NRD77649.1 hypothetical protein [Neobacillus endophyticus]